MDYTKNLHRSKAICNHHIESLQELQSQFEEERMKLEVTISCLKTELENEKSLKHESDLNVIELHKMTHYLKACNSKFQLFVSSNLNLQL